MMCMRVIERALEEGIDIACPNSATVEKYVGVNNVGYLLHLCDFHDAEHAAKAAAARARRNEHNERMRRQHGPRRPDRKHLRG